MNIRYSDSDLGAASFVALAQRVWPRDYDLVRIQAALARTTQRRGIGRHLMIRALQHAPRGKLFFGAHPEAIGFFERLGCTRGPVGFVATRISGP